MTGRRLTFAALIALVFAGFIAVVVIAPAIGIDCLEGGAAENCEY